MPAGNLLYYNWNFLFTNKKKKFMEINVDVVDVQSSQIKLFFFLNLNNVNTFS